MNKQKSVCDFEATCERAVARVQKDMPDNSSFYGISNLFKILADSTRLKILWALSIEEMCVGDLATLVGMTNSSISHQLKPLRLANLIKYEKQGRTVYYSISSEYVKDVIVKGHEYILR